MGELVSMPGDDVAVIRVSGLTKRYGDLSAVDDVGLEVNAGEVYALVGLNGAGKTTPIRMLLDGPPQFRQLSVAGRPHRPVGVGGRGVLVETPSSYPDLTVRENLEIARRLRMMPGHRAVDDALDRFDRRPYARSGADPVAGQRAAARAGQGAAAPPPDPGSRRAGQRLGPSRRRRDPRAAGRASPGTTASPSCCPATCCPRSRGSPPDGVLHHGRLIEELDPDRLHTARRSRGGSRRPGPGPCRRGPARCRVRGTPGRRCAAGRRQRGRAPPRGRRDRAGHRRRAADSGSRSWRKTSRATSCGSSGTPTPSPLSGDEPNCAPRWRPRWSRSADWPCSAPPAWPSWWPPWSGCSSCSCCRTSAGRGCWGCWAPRPSFMGRRGPARVPDAGLPDRRRRRDAVRNDPDLAVRSGVLGPDREGSRPTDLESGRGAGETGGGPGLSMLLTAQLVVVSLLWGTS